MDIINEHPAVSAAPKKKKRALPFKRTVARNPSVGPELASPLATAGNHANDEENDLDLFRHSKEVFPEILREAEEEVAKVARIATTPDGNRRKRRNSSMDEENGEARKRTSFSDSSQRAASFQALSPADDSADGDCIIDVKGKGKEIQSNKIITPRKTRSSAIITASPTAGVAIPDSDESGDSDDEFVLVKPPHKGEISSSQPTTRRPGAKREGDSDSDLEEVESWEPTPVEEKRDEHNEWIIKAREDQARTQNAVALVMVSCQIPGTALVKLKRRLRQNVQLIIDTWADMQRQNGIEFGAERHRLFLTWKGNKVYNSSSLASLGIEVDDQGEVKYGQGEGWYTSRGVPAMHLEIWTEEAYIQWEKVREHERALRYGIIDDDSDLEALHELAPMPAKKGIKVVLKAKDLEPMKSSIKEDTTVEFMIEAFRQQRGLGEEWDVAIFFDGERLDEESLVKDADIDPDESNQFEVHIKKRH